MDEVERATLDWVHLFNHQRLFGSIRYVPPAEYEMMYYQKLTESAQAA
jgi:putative transposase